MKSLKFLLAAALPMITLSVSAHATEAFEREVLTALVVNAGQIELTSEIDADQGAPFYLPEMMAQFLSGGYLAASKGESITLGNVSVSCEAAKNTKKTDAHICAVIFLNGDFSVSKDGISGPESESSVSFRMPVSRDAKGKIQIHGKKFKVDLAG